jgi:CDP-diacylglycerol--glycerol-3-phosphate 3-phosphatidyltransferase
VTAGEASERAALPAAVPQLASRAASDHAGRERAEPVDHLADPVAAVGNLNLANALTALRVLLVPVFVVALFQDGGHQDGWRWAAWSVFAIAAITDTIDGRVARRRQTVTNFGKIADPIADKALTGAALIGLSSLGDLPWAVTIVVLTREVLVTLLRFWVIRHGVIAASRGGKAKTLCLNFGMGMFVLPFSGFLQFVAEVLLTAGVVIALVTAVDYVLRALRLRRDSARAGS